MASERLLISHLTDKIVERGNAIDLTNFFKSTLLKDDVQVGFVGSHCYQDIVSVNEVSSRLFSQTPLTRWTPIPVK
jgi:hypothetical protein